MRKNYNDHTHANIRIYRYIHKHVLYNNNNIFYRDKNFIIHFDRTFIFRYVLKY